MSCNGDARSTSPMDVQLPSSQHKWLVHSMSRIPHNLETESLTERFVLAVEVRLKLESTARFDTISKFVHQTLEQDEQIYLPSSIEGWDSHPVLSQNVELIRATESSKHQSTRRVDLSLAHIPFPIGYFVSSMSSSRFTRRRRYVRSTCLST